MTTPFSLAASPDGIRVYLADGFGPEAGIPAHKAVYVISTANTHPVLVTVQVGASPAGVAVNPAGARLYVTNTGDNTVSAFSTSGSTYTLLATIPVGSLPMGLAWKP